MTDNDLQERLRVQNALLLELVRRDGKSRQALANRVEDSLDTLEKDVDIDPGPDGRWSAVTDEIDTADDLRRGDGVKTDGGEIILPGAGDPEPPEEALELANQAWEDRQDTLLRLTHSGDTHVFLTGLYRHDGAKIWGVALDSENLHARRQARRFVSQRVLNDYLTQGDSVTLVSAADLPETIESFWQKYRDVRHPLDDYHVYIIHRDDGRYKDEITLSQEPPASDARPRPAPDDVDVDEREAQYHAGTLREVLMNGGENVPFDVDLKQSPSFSYRRDDLRACFNGSIGNALKQSFDDPPGDDVIVEFDAEQQTGDGDVDRGDGVETDGGEVQRPPTLVLTVKEFCEKLRELAGQKDNPEEWAVVLGHPATRYEVIGPGEIEHDVAIVGHQGWGAEAFRDGKFVEEVSGDGIDRTANGALLVRHDVLSDTAVEELSEPLQSDRDSADDGEGDEDGESVVTDGGTVVRCRCGHCWHHHLGGCQNCDCPEFDENDGAAAVLTDGGFVSHRDLPGWVSSTFRDKCSLPGCENDASVRDSGVTASVIVYGPQDRPLGRPDEGEELRFCSHRCAGRSLLGIPAEEFDGDDDDDDDHDDDDHDDDDDDHDDDPDGAAAVVTDGSDGVKTDGETTEARGTFTAGDEQIEILLRQTGESTTQVVVSTQSPSEEAWREEMGAVMDTTPEHVIRQLAANLDVEVER